MAPKPNQPAAPPADAGPDIGMHRPPVLAHHLLDAIGEAVIATDPDGHILYWNDAATRLYGWRADEVIGASILEITPAAAEHAAAIMDRLRQGEPWTGEFLVRHRDGRLFPVLVTDTAVRDENGRLVAIVGVSLDITRQKEAESAAFQAEQKMELVTEAAATALWEWELATDTVRWSESARDAFGYDPADVVRGWEWWSGRIHPEDRARVTDGFRRLLGEESVLWTDEYRFLTGDRGYATVFDRARVIRDGAGVAVRVTGSMVDVTDRRRLHEAQRFLAQTSMILDLSLDYEATLPTIARLTVHALADACILHVSAGEGFGEFGTAAHIDPRLQGALEDAAAFLGAGPPVGSVFERVLRDGETLRLADVPAEAVREALADRRLREIAAGLEPRSVLLVPLRARRTVVGFALLTRSQDDRPYDDADQRTAEELGRRIGLAIDHARLFQAAELATRAKADFLSVISHELRTPLTAVLGYAELLSGEISGPLNETQHRQIGRIRAGSDRLLRLIEGILTFARLEAGSEKPQYETVSLEGLVQRAAELVAPRAAEKRVGFEMTLEGAPSAVRTDPEKFIQVLLSLLNNAVKFTHEGGVHLRVYREGNLLHLDVRDSGSGIAPEHLPYVFNPFWQAEQPETRRAGGAGLGLSVARRLARLIKGDVLVRESTPRGTTFSFQIPLRPRA